VVAAAGCFRSVGIGGRTSSHELPDIKLSKALVAFLRLSCPPTVVSAPLTTAKAKYLHLYLVHLFPGTVYQYKYTF
jgi:hypothetical protein